MLISPRTFKGLYTALSMHSPQPQVNGQHTCTCKSTGNCREHVQVIFLVKQTLNMLHPTPIRCMASSTSCRVRALAISSQNLATGNGFPFMIMNLD